jgi:tetratricopeptide (TPR) repeat protein
MGSAILIAVLLFQAQSLAEQGAAALDAGRYEDAVRILTRAVAADPSDDYSQFNLAVAYSLLGRDAEAIPIYKKVLELRPGLYEANINLGQSLLRSGDASAAIPYLKQAHEQKPSEFRPAYYLAEALSDAGRAEEALDPYTKALAADPASAPAELGLARALLRVGRRAEAEPHYRKAAELNPELRSYLLELASRYEENNENEAALRLYREFPEDAAARERMGVLLLRSGDLEGAAAALEAAVRLSPTKANRTALAQTYLDLKQAERAEALLAQVVAAEPRDFDLRMHFARILRDQRKIPAAIEQFRAAIDINPNAAMAWSELAGMLILAEQYPEAIAALDRARDLGLENPGHLFIRAITYDRLRARQEAVEYYRRFLEASKDQNPDQEFQARQRIRVLELEMGKR